MLAQCYLADGEGQKVEKRLGTNVCSAALSSSPWSSPGRHLSAPQALQCFQEAATEVEKEDFLMRLTSSEDVEAAASTRLQYYNKVPDVRTHTHTHTFL